MQIHHLINAYQIQTVAGGPFNRADYHLTKGGNGSSHNEQVVRTVKPKCRWKAAANWNQLLKIGSSTDGEKSPALFGLRSLMISYGRMVADITQSKS